MGLIPFYVSVIWPLLIFVYFICLFIKLYLGNKFHFSNAYRSVKYIGSRAK